MADEFYLQDSRNYVGNDMLFWGIKGNGYVTDMRKAQVYTKAEAVAQHQCRESDIPWPKDYIDARTRPAVDMQNVKRDEALAGTGITITTPKKTRYSMLNCSGCGQFISDIRRYSEDCQNCGTDNRP